jgi:hypothetical protein
MRKMPWAAAADASSEEREATAKVTVASMSPSAVAEDEPIEIKIEQLRQWGFCVLPRVIAQLPEVAAEVAAFQADAREYYSTVTGMSDAMRAEMMRKLASSTASKLEARQLGNVSGGGTAASEEATDAEAADWRCEKNTRIHCTRRRGVAEPRNRAPCRHIEEAADYERGVAAGAVLSQAAFIPCFAESLAEPRVLAVARAVLDQHVRVAQVEALGKSVQPGRRPHNNHRGWQ